jgi:hypothetical protein
MKKSNKTKWIPFKDEVGPRIKVVMEIQYGCLADWEDAKAEVEDVAMTYGRLMSTDVYREVLV